MAKSNDVVGFGVEDGQTDFYGITLAIAADGTVIPSDNTRNLGGGRRMMLWKNVDDSTVVYLVVCIQNEARWLSLRPPQPCETLQQAAALRELIHGLTVSPVAVMMTAGDDDGNY